MEDLESVVEEYDNKLEEVDRPTTGGEPFPVEEVIIVEKIS